MKKSKSEKLSGAEWEVGDVEDFLALNEKEFQFKKLNNYKTAP